MRPTREIATNNQQTYFVTSNTTNRQPLFRYERFAELFVDVLLSYRPERYLLHDFTLMPDHFHLLITPSQSLERAVQCLKGGFSFRAGRELEWKGDVWVAGFSDHRIRDWSDFDVHRRYIALNPVKRRLVKVASDYAFGSGSGRFVMDPCPRGLKPQTLRVRDGAAEAAPFQNSASDRSSGK